MLIAMGRPSFCASTDPRIATMKTGKAPFRPSRIHSKKIQRTAAQVNGKAATCPHGPASSPAGHRRFHCDIYLNVSGMDDHAIALPVRSRPRLATKSVDRLLFSAFGSVLLLLLEFSVAPRFREGFKLWHNMGAGAGGFHQAAQAVVCG
jgi:hypothetical protein